MSAESTGSTPAGNKTTFLFKQEVPIPTYLVALVAGKLEGRWVDAKLAGMDERWSTCCRDS